MGLNRFKTLAKRALGPLSDGSKDHGTHNVPIFLGWNFILFQTKKNTVILSIGYGKLKGLGELMHILNAPESELRWDKKFVGSTRFPTCLWHMVP